MGLVGWLSRELVGNIYKPHTHSLFVTHTRTVSDLFIATVSVLLYFYHFAHTRSRIPVGVVDVELLQEHAIV